MSYAKLYNTIEKYALYITISYYAGLWTIGNYGLLRSKVYTLLTITNHCYPLLWKVIYFYTHYLLLTFIKNYGGG